jgi:hypothetical protein
MIRLIGVIILLVLGYYWNNFIEEIFPFNPDGSNNDSPKHWFFRFLGWGVLIGLYALIDFLVMG